jgi:hypothetical protein
MAADSLRKLHSSLVDNRKGYEKAVEDAEPNVKALFREMAELKAKDHAELHSGLTRMGEKPDDSGSFMATVHKTVIGVRAATTGLGTNSLSLFCRAKSRSLTNMTMRSGNARRIEKSSKRLRVKSKHCLRRSLIWSVWQLDPFRLCFECLANRWSGERLRDGPKLKSLCA